MIKFQLGNNNNKKYEISKEKLDKYPESLLTKISNRIEQLEESVEYKDGIFYLDCYSVIFTWFDNIIQLYEENPNLEEIFNLDKNISSETYRTDYKHTRWLLEEYLLWDSFKEKLVKHLPIKIKYSFQNRIYEIKERHLNRYPDSLLYKLNDYRKTGKYFIKEKDGAIILEGNIILEENIMKRNEKVEGNLEGNIILEENLERNIREEIMERIFGIILEIYKNREINIKEILEVEKYFDDKSDGYFLKEENFLILKRTLEYFQLWKIVEPKFSVTEINEIQEQHIIYEEKDYLKKKEKRKKRKEDMKNGVIDIEKLRKKLAKNVEHKTSENFVKVVKTINGLVSGSFVLQSILEEDWNNENYKSDIDIYVNIFMLENMIYSYEKKSQKKIYDINEKRRNIVSVTFGLPIKDIEILDKKDWEDGYGLCGCIEYLAKFKIRGTEIDLVVTRCTPNFFIKNFDFSFNSIYFNFDTLCVFDWNSIIERTSLNLYKNSRFNISEEEKYKENRKRILKYFDRGFIILMK